jgi:hypothetical protein
VGAIGGSAGTIHAKQQIQQFMAYMRRYIGEGNPVSVVWDHSEAKLNLLHAADVQLKDVIGLSGRIQVDAPQSPLPVKKVGTAYRMVGTGLVLDPEPFTIDGVDSMFKKKSQAVGISPVGVFGVDDALLIYSIVCMCRDVFELLHPSADLSLPDQIAATAMLSSDTITISFDKAPSIRLCWIFSINLAIKSVSISDSNVHVEFSGSRWVKSRDFEVQ